MLTTRPPHYKGFRLLLRDAPYRIHILEFHIFLIGSSPFVSDGHWLVTCVIVEGGTEEDRRYKRNRGER